ncbi:hypothetical protein [Rhodanobacter sp. FW106-PBR-R2A-1-13]|uniref:hypothetical protein n=1 Tax=Rhodanobacter sp. FW106-PBR-R2A-1-13 TaxID=3454845 RepID=UPI0034E488AC
MIEFMGIVVIIYMVFSLLGRALHAIAPGTARHRRQRSTWFMADTPDADDDVWASVPDATYVPPPFDEGIGHEPSLGEGIRHEPWGPACNVDGTPMCGDVDIHGHPYGVTDSFLHEVPPHW